MAAGFNSFDAGMNAFTHSGFNARGGGTEWATVWAFSQDMDVLWRFDTVAAGYGLPNSLCVMGDSVYVAAQSGIVRFALDGEFLEVINPGVNHQDILAVPPDLVISVVGAGTSRITVGGSVVWNRPLFSGLLRLNGDIYGHAFSGLLFNPSRMTTAGATVWTASSGGNASRMDVATNVYWAFPATVANMRRLNNSTGAQISVTSLARTQFAYAFGAHVYAGSDHISAAILRRIPAGANDADLATAETGVCTDAVAAGGHIFAAAHRTATVDVWEMCKFTLGFGFVQQRVFQTELQNLPALLRIVDSPGGILYGCGHRAMSA